MDADYDVINLGRITLAREYDVEKPQSPNELKNITDDASNSILEMYFAK